MFIRTHSISFLSFLVASTTMIQSSDTRGISYCNHSPESPYVCLPCIKDLNNESLSKCTCLYGEVLKKEPNLKCPFHKNKYLMWLDENKMVEEYNKIAYPELEEKKEQQQTFSTSTLYQPYPQPLSSSMPSQKKPSEKLMAKERRKRAKEQIKRTKSERKEKRSSQEKSKSTPSSLRSSAERRVHFGIVPDVIEARPRVMRRGEKPAQQQKISSSEEEKERVYEKRKYYSDDE
jgi:hypothetical protein